MPSPKRSHSSSTPKDFFMHLLNIVTLYVSVVSFMTLLYQYINISFPDLLNFQYSGALDTIRWTTASIVIMYPVYFFTSWLLYRDIAAYPEKAEFRVRKWLIYFTLFVAALTIIIDLVTLVYHFLSGELTLRFILKVLVVLVTTSTVFGFYLWDLKRKDFAKSAILKLFAWVVSLVVLAAIVGGFFLVGSPFYQRQVRIDETRVNNLQTIQSEVVQYWTQKGELPPRLDDLKNSLSGFTPPVDPETGVAYEYRIITPLSFELCGTFKTATPAPLRAAGRNGSSIAYPGHYEPYGQNWIHEAGRTCFERTIDPDQFKRDGIAVPVKGM